MDVIRVRRSAWQVAYPATLLAFVVAVAIVMLFWRTFSRLVESWSISDYQFGWIVYPLFALLVFHSRDRGTGVALSSSWSGTVAMAALIAVWLLARAVGVQVAEFIAVTLMIFAAYWAVAGRTAARQVAYPMLLLLAAVPLADFMVQPLMQFTASIADWLFRLTGTVAYREGQFFYLPGGAFEVADVCSGLKNLLAGTTVAFAFSYIAFERVAVRLIFITAVALVLVLANGLRAYIVMSVASATDMQVLGGRDHIYFGMAFFFVVIVCLLAVGYRISDRQQDRAEPSSDRRRPSEPRRYRATPAVLALALIAFGLGADRAVSSFEGPAIDGGGEPFPEFQTCAHIGAWPDDATRPVFRGSDYESSATFECEDHALALFLATYVDQYQGKELINSRNQVSPGHARADYVEIAVVDEQNNVLLRVNQAIVEESAGTGILRYWYRVGDRTATSEFGAKLLEAAYALSFDLRASSVVVLRISQDSPDNELKMLAQAEEYTRRLHDWNLRRIERRTLD